MQRWKYWLTSVREYSEDVLSTFYLPHGTVEFKGFLPFFLINLLRKIKETNGQFSLQFDMKPMLLNKDEYVGNWETSLNDKAIFQTDCYTFQ